MPHVSPHRPRTASLAGLVLLLLAAALALPRPAAAHTRLESSAPAAGDTVRGGVTEVRLRFSRAAQTAFTSIVLEGPAGAVPVGGARAVGTEEREFVFDLGAPLAPGAYTVRWRTAGLDGHPLRGSFGFVVEAATVTSALPDDTATAAPDPGTPQSVAPSGEGSPVETETGDASEPSSPAAAPLHVALRWLSSLGLLGMVGAVVFRLLVLRPSAVPAAVLAAAAGGARRLGAAAALLFLATLPFRLWLQAAALRAADEPFTAAQLSALLAAPWGWGWLLGMAGAALAAAALMRARPTLAAVGAAAAAFSPALMGHAAAVEGASALAVAADGVHVLAAAAWLGGLAVLVVAGIPAALAAPGTDALPSLAALVARFSPMALASAALAAATGTVSALLHLAEPAQLWTTSYGLALLAKLVLVALVAAAGFFNWRRVRPALGTPRGAATLRRSAGVELAFGVLVVLATAILVAQPTP